MADKWRQQKQTLTQNRSHARAHSALLHVQVTECPFLAPLAPRSCKAVTIHPDIWLCKGQPLPKPGCIFHTTRSYLGLKHITHLFICTTLAGTWQLHRDPTSL